ncbi:MAG: YbaY family lipoprotein [Candidatus Binatia bacterium]
MSRRTLALVGGLAVIMSGGVARGQENPASEITGTVTYLQRLALPPEAAVRLWLEDVSRADAPAEVVKEVTVPTQGRQVPIPFRLPYDEGQIDESHRYHVRASIVVGDTLLFTSAAGSPVLTHGAPRKITIVARPAGRNERLVPQEAAGHGAPKAGAALEGTYWKLILVGGEPAVILPEAHEAHLTLEAEGKKLGGSSGCNRLLGTYELDGEHLRFAQVGSTRMACAEPLMKQEHAFVQALEGTTTYRATSETLELRDGERVLARFELRPGK